MLVRHDAQVRIVITCNDPEHDKPCSEMILKPAEVDTHYTIEAYKHGKISGMDSGYRVQHKTTLVNPDRDMLKNGQLCPCEMCVSYTAEWEKVS